MNKLDRKDFLKLGGGAIAGTIAGATLSGAPFLGLQWLVEWTQDQYSPPRGPEKMLSTVCEACADKCQLSIRMIGERAVKIETSNGGCPLGQNALQLLYHPERIDAPLKRTGSKGSVSASAFKKVTWEEAFKDIAGRMDKMIKDKKGNLIAGISKNPSLSADLLDLMMAASGSANAFTEPSLNSLSAAALGGSMDYDFTGTDFVLSFGARLFEGWGEPSSMNKALLRWKEKNAKIVQIDTVCTRTASLASQWVPVKAGTESIVALGMVNYLAKKGKNAGGANFGAWSAAIAQYTPEEVEKLTGVPAKTLIEVADAFARAGSPVAVAGRGAKGVSSSSTELAAVFALNAMVNSRAVKLVKRAPIGNAALTAEAAESLKAAKKAAGLDDFIKNGAFEMLLVNDADPVYKSVYGKQLAEKMQKAFVVAISPLLNDTAAYADYIFPSLTILETATSAGDAPLKPYAKAVHAGDVLIGIAKLAESLKASFPWAGYQELVKNAGKTAAAGAPAFNVDALNKHLEAMKKDLASTEFPCSLVPIEVPAIGDGDGLAFPYVLKMLDDSTFSQGKQYVLLNRETGKKYGICDGGSISIKSARGSLGGIFGDLRARLTDTVAPDAVAIPLGFGHKAYTAYAEGKGCNPKDIMTSDIDPVTGTANWWLTRIKIS